ncbi:F-box/LRR-repeat protein 15, partial [Clonorchis sinensis]
QRLELFGCFRLNSDIFAILGRCQQLRALAFGHLHHLSSDGLLDLVGKLPLLSSLDLRGTQTLSSDLNLSRLADKCPHLEEVVLANMHSLKHEAGIAQMLRRLPRLRVLDLCGLGAVGDLTMEALASGCPQLEELDVSCTSVTQKGLSHLTLAPAKSLRCLRISHCREITRDVLEKLVKACTKPVWETISTGHFYDHVRVNTFMYVNSKVGYQFSFRFAVLTITFTTRLYVRGTHLYERQHNPSHNMRTNTDNCRYRGCGRQANLSDMTTASPNSIVERVKLEKFPLTNEHLVIRKTILLPLIKRDHAIPSWDLLRYWHSLPVSSTPHFSYHLDDYVSRRKLSGRICSLLNRKHCGHVSPRLAMIETSKTISTSTGKMSSEYDATERKTRHVPLWTKLTDETSRVPFFTVFKCDFNDLFPATLHTYHLPLTIMVFSRFDKRRYSTRICDLNRHPIEPSLRSFGFLLVCKPVEPAVRSNVRIETSRPNSLHPWAGSEKHLSRCVCPPKSFLGGLGVSDIGTVNVMCDCAPALHRTQGVHLIAYAASYKPHVALPVRHGGQVLASQTCEMENQGPEVAQKVGPLDTNYKTRVPHGPKQYRRIRMMKKTANIMVTYCAPAASDFQTKAKRRSSGFIDRFVKFVDESIDQAHPKLFPADGKCFWFVLWKS